MILESPSYQTLKREYDFGVEHYNELLNEYNKEHKALEIVKPYIEIQKYEHMDSRYLIIKEEAVEINKETYDLLKEVLK